MRKLYKLGSLFGVICLLLSTGIQAQNVQYSTDQLIGKWILKSASFNGREVPLQNSKDAMSFEFSEDGSVVLINFDGRKERGAFLLQDNKIIDPSIPEYPNADIVMLTKDDLVLEIREEVNKVLMTFELVETD